MRTKTLLTQFILTAWLAICISLFVLASRFDYLHIAQFPNWVGFANSLSHISPISDTLRLLGAFSGVLLFSLACLSFGLWVLRGLASKGDQLALLGAAFVLGEIIFSTWFLILVTLGYLTPTITAVSLLAGFLVGFPTLRAIIPRWPVPALPAAFQRKERIILALLCAVFCIGLLYSSARLSYDAVADYFSHAKIMAISHRPIILYPNDFLAVSSFHPGILFAAAIQLFGDQSARMISWMNGLAILLLGLALAKELGLTPRARLWFLTLMLTSTAFVDLLGDGKIELISTAPILAAVYWMLRSAEVPSKGYFLLIGSLTGFAIISRPYNIFLVPVFVLLFYLNQMRIQIQKGGFRFWEFARPILWMFPPLILLGAFHLLENWLLLGSPLAPLTYAQSLGAADWQWQFNPADLVWFRILYPFTATFVNSPQSLGNISPFVVACLPFLLVEKIRRGFHPSPQMKQLATVAAITLVAWLALFFTVVEIRYVFFLWFILFLLAAQALETITNNAEGLTRLLVAPLAIGLLTFVGARVAVMSVQTFSPIDKNGQAHCYDIGFCTFFEAANDQAPLGARVFVLNAYRYYLRPDLFACSSRMDEYASLSQLAQENPSAFWAEVYRRGFAFLVYEENFSVRHTHFGVLPDAASAPEWLHVEVLSAISQAGIVYRLEASDAPYQRETSCVRNERGIWEIQRGK